jgi:hypothetical protein
MYLRHGKAIDSTQREFNRAVLGCLPHSGSW